MALEAWPNSKPGAWPAFLTRAGLCLAALVPLAACGGLAADFTLPKVWLLSLAVLLGAAGKASSPGTIRSTSLDRPILALFGALLVSTAFSCDRVLSVLGMYNYYAYGVWPLAMVAGLYFLAAWANTGDREWSARLLLVSAGVAGAYGLVQAAGRDVFPSLGVLLMGDRPVSTMGSPISLGAFEALCIPLAIHRVAREGKDRVLGWVVLALATGGLVVSGSRAGWLGAACGAAVWLACSGRGGLPASRRGRSALALAVLALAGVAAWRISIRLRTREVGEVDTARVEVWRIAWKSFKAAPWTGWGPDSFELAFRRNKTEDYIKATSTVEYQAHAHNDFLQALATTGLLGCAAYAWLLWSIILLCREALASPDRRSWGAAVGGALLSLFVSMKFNPVPMETFLAAALAAGTLGGAESPPRRAGGGRGAAGKAAAAAGLVLFGLGSFYIASRLLAADFRLGQARGEVISGRPDEILRRFDSVLRLNPCETVYHMAHINLMSVGAARSPDPSMKAVLLDRAVASGSKAVSCHPASSLAYFCLGGAEFSRAEQTGSMESLSAAEAALDRALELDPNFFTILEFRLKAALLRGDQALVGRLADRLRFLYALPRRQVRR